MPDVFSKEERSRIMRLVKGTGNLSTEKKLIEIFKDNSIKGWRRHYNVAGKPDFVFLKQKIAVFADGCFWHGHTCRNINPKQNANYWRKKQQRTILRDRLVTKQFKCRGWVVVRFWECKIQKGKIPLNPLKKQLLIER